MPKGVVCVKRMWAIAALCLLLCGCGRQQTGWMAEEHLVVSVLVERGGERLLFADPEKVRAVLGYFRGLETIPTETGGFDARQVTFLYADGHRRTAFLTDERYLGDGSGWLAVTQAPVPFQKLLDSLPPDNYTAP